ncbi:ABC transporter permease/substrate-binding protein [Roseivirga sp. BDSF3-8]|uniref:ABC transporter permease/substrate-binding protein n=1 Tax=Roseivirga sp. BDSF3-8 TaxID=3241598 RepID=UPI003532657C
MKATGGKVMDNKGLLSYLWEQRSEIGEQLVEHIWLTLIALTIAVIFGVTLGIWLSRNRRVASPVLGAVNVIQTIPSVALLGFLLPFFGIGITPAIIALFLYALLPIVRNTFTGIAEVNPAVREAARGMGLSPGQLLSRVELPLALPTIFAGIRTAAVINVGIATLCALIAAGGLGEFIFRGISLNNTYMIMAGAIPAALLALAIDGLLGLVQRLVHRRGKLFAIIGIGLVAVLAGVFTLNISGSKSFIAGFPSEFMERGDGYPGLQDTYGLDMETVELEIGLMYQALKNEKVDLISGFSTDGRIVAYDLRPLEDDKSYFPPYYAAPLVRRETLDKYPDLKEAVNLLEGRISDKEMIRLNYMADQEKLDTYDIAKSFLDSLGFDTGIRREGEADILIGSKNFTESYILAQMLGILVENYTGLDVDMRLGFGGTKLVFDALRTGEIDIYPEYTGTGLLVILQENPDEVKDIMGDPNRVYDYVNQQFSEQYELQWLGPLGFNNTFAMMMREQDAESLGIRSISDLKKHLEGK